MANSGSVQQGSEFFDAELPDVSDHFTVLSEPLQKSSGASGHPQTAPLLVRESVSLSPSASQIVDLTGSDDGDGGGSRDPARALRSRRAKREKQTAKTSQVIDLLGSPDESLASEQERRHQRLRHARSSPPAQRQTARPAAKAPLSRVERDASHEQAFLRTMLASLPSLFETAYHLEEPAASSQSSSLSGRELGSGSSQDAAMGAALCLPAASHRPSSPRVRATPKVLDLTDAALPLDPAQSAFASSSSPVLSCSLTSICCRICLDRIAQPAATDCGHVFCHACLAHAVASQGKCPLCRKSLTLKKIRRLYL